MIIKSLLEKLVQFFIKPRRPKTTKLQKTITIKLNKTPSSNKISQSVTSNTQIKQVERKQHQTKITTFSKQITDTVTEFSPTVITVSVNHMSELKPGYLWDTCSIMNTEDYTEILKYGHDIKNKLYNGPMYVLTLSEYEYANKKCPKDHDEKVIDKEFTGKPRDLHSTLLKLSKSLQVPIYSVNVKNSPEMKQLEKKLLLVLRYSDLHPGDSTFLAFAKLTNSILITSDKRLLLCSVQAQCPKPTNFDEFTEKIMQPSPITIVLRERRKLHKKQQSRWNQ